jgi:hypothetical protein
MRIATKSEEEEHRQTIALLDSPSVRKYGRYPKVVSHNLHEFKSSDVHQHHDHTSGTC